MRDTAECAPWRAAGGGCPQCADSLAQQQAQSAFQQQGSNAQQQASEARELAGRVAARHKAWAQEHEAAEASLDEQLGVIRTPRAATESALQGKGPQQRAGSGGLLHPGIRPN